MENNMNNVMREVEVYNLIKNEAGSNALITLLQVMKQVRAGANSLRMKHVHP